MVGCILALPLAISAPIIHIMADIFQFTFMVRGMNLGKGLVPIAKNPLADAYQEVAASSAVDMENPSIAWHAESIDEILARFSINRQKSCWPDGDSQKSVWPQSIANARTNTFFTNFV